MIRALLPVTVLVAACYSPEVEDCVVACSGPGTCVAGQVCGSDGWCASPEVAGLCEGGGDGATLRIEVEGKGRVEIAPLDVECDDECVYDVELGKGLVLVARPGRHQRFAGWSGGCSGGATCELSVDRPETFVGVRFESEDDD